MTGPLSVSLILLCRRIRQKGIQLSAATPQPNSASAAKKAAEKVDYGVIPSEARNPSLFITQEKRDSSANSVPRNDNILSFSAACKAD